jgi:hypothetical protein
MTFARVLNVVRCARLSPERSSFAAISSVVLAMVLLVPISTATTASALCLRTKSSYTNGCYGEISHYSYVDQGSGFTLTYTAAKTAPYSNLFIHPSCYAVALYAAWIQPYGGPSFLITGLTLYPSSLQSATSLAPSNNGLSFGVPTFPGAGSNFAPRNGVSQWNIFHAGC